MAYLRGNTVIDGNLYVEGSLTYSGARPDMVDATAVYKQTLNGEVAGRHLKCENAEYGSLIDSSIRENTSNEGVSNGITNYGVNFYFDFNNNNTPHTNHSDDSFSNNETRISFVRMNFPVENFYVINKNLIPVYSDPNNQDVSTIISWGYASIQS